MKRIDLEFEKIHISESAKLQKENAEQLSFSDNTFDHVNCQGVVHHTPNADKAVSEIARVLKPAGTASISVYYHNVILQLWPWLRWIGYPIMIYANLEKLCVE